MKIIGASCFRYTVVNRGRVSRAGGYSNRGVFFALLYFGGTVTGPDDRAHDRETRPIQRRRGAEERFSPRVCAAARPFASAVS